MLDLARRSPTSREELEAGWKLYRLKLQADLILMDVTLRGAAQEMIDRIRARKAEGIPDLSPMPKDDDWKDWEEEQRGDYR